MRAETVLRIALLALAWVSPAVHLAVAAEVPPAAPGATVVTNQSFPFNRVGPDLFALGEVVLDKARRTVSFPVLLNQKVGSVEYAVVTLQGKTHESVFKTPASPVHIHMSLLLLGARPADTNYLSDDPAVDI